jgi:hypothetical protein
MTNTKHSKVLLPSSQDIDWASVEQKVLSEYINLSELCEEYGFGVTKPTFKSWMMNHFSGKYRIDFGRQGRGNFIRFIPIAAQNSLTDQMRKLRSQYGEAAFNRSFAEVLLGDA